MLSGVKKLFSVYPRQFGNPTRVQVNSFEELVAKMNTYNGKTRCFSTVLNYTNGNHIKLDKIFFDFDEMEKNGGTEPRCIHNMRKLHSKMKEDDIQHTMVCSGGGFHFYIFADDVTCNGDAKECLCAAQTHYMETLKLSPDPTSIGDVARIYGIPGTINLKRKRFVIFITEEDLEKGYEHIQQKALTWNHPMKVYGTKLLDLSKFKGNGRKSSLEEMPVGTFNGEVEEKILKNAPPCVKKALLEDGSHWARYIYTIWMKESGFPREVCDAIAQKYFSKFPRTDHYKNNWLKYCAVEMSKNVYANNKLLMPRCSYIANVLKKCPGKCGQYDIHDKFYKR